MKKYFLFALIFSNILLSCSKPEGLGGRSAIIGKVHLTDNTGANQGVYFVPEYNVYIIYGTKDDIYDDKVKTNFDGSFQFNNLRKGSYRIYAYSTNNNTPSGVEPIFKAADISKHETFDVGTIEVIK